MGDTLFRGLSLVMAAGLISALLLLWTLQATRWPSSGESGTLHAHLRSLSAPAESVSWARCGSLGLSTGGS